MSSTCVKEVCLVLFIVWSSLMMAAALVGMFSGIAELSNLFQLEADG